MLLICKLIHHKLRIRKHSIDIGIVEQDVAISLLRWRMYNICIDISNSLEVATRISSMHMPFETAAAAWQSQPRYMYVAHAVGMICRFGDVVVGGNMLVRHLAYKHAVDSLSHFGRSLQLNLYAALS